MRYKKPKTELKKNYITELDGYPQILRGVMELPDNYITESVEKVTARRLQENTIQS